MFFLNIRLNTYINRMVDIYDRWLMKMVVFDKSQGIKDVLLQENDHVT